MVKSTRTAKKIGLDWQNSDTHHAFLYDCDVKMLACVAAGPRSPSLLLKLSVNTFIH